jgi:DNA polymerase-3 subunit delta'
MWQGLYGHDAAVEHFRRSIAAGRLASAYLLAGPEGVGKRSFAVRLAKALLCGQADPAALAPCGRCQSCVLCDAGSHPDLHLVARQRDSKTLKLEQFIGDRDHRNAEGFCHDFALKPLLGGRRIGIIDDADWFTPESANSLLKLIEEPPPGSLLLLLGASRSRQLPTILSRVQVVRLGEIPPGPLRDLILALGLSPDAASATELAARSGGSIARARELADAAAWVVRDRFATAWRRGDIDPGPLAKEFDEFIAAAGNVADARRQRFRQVLGQAVDVLRSSLRDAAAADASPDAALAALDRTLEAEEQLDRNANQATLLACWLDDLANIPG